MSTSNSQWFVEPIGDLTNESLAAELAKECLTTESEGLITVQGKPVRGYWVPYRFITMLEKSAVHRKFFRVYRKRGDAEPKRHTFLQQRSKQKQTKEYQRMKAELEKRKK